MSSTRSRQSYTQQSTLMMHSKNSISEKQCDSIIEGDNSKDVLTNIRTNSPLEWTLPSNSLSSSNNIDNITTSSPLLATSVEIANRQHPSRTSSPFVSNPNGQINTSSHQSSSNAIYPRPAIFPTSSMPQNHAQANSYRMYWPQSATGMPPGWGSVSNVSISSQQSHFQNVNVYPHQQPSQLYLHSIHHSYPHVPRITKSHSLGTNIPVVIPRTVSPSHLNSHSISNNSHSILTNPGNDTNSSISHPQPSRIHHRSSFPSSNTQSFSTVNQVCNESITPSPLQVIMPHMSCPVSPVSSNPSSALQNTPSFDDRSGSNSQSTTAPQSPNQSKSLSTPPHDLAGSLPFIHKPLHPKIQPAMASQKMNSVPYQPHMYSRRPITFVNGAPDSGRRRKRSRLNYFDGYSTSMQGTLSNTVDDSQAISSYESNINHDKSISLTFKQYQMKRSDSIEESQTIQKRDELDTNDSEAFLLSSISPDCNHESNMRMYSNHLDENVNQNRYDDSMMVSQPGKRGRKRGSKNAYMSRLSKFVRVPQTKIPVTGPQRRMSTINTDTQNGSSGDSTPSYDVRRGSSISDSGIIATENGLFQCADCGKTYKHQSCLLKHRWEHSEFWNDAKKYSLTKHQQVQIMEAAQILLELEAASVEELKGYQNTYPSQADDRASTDISDKFPLAATGSA